MANLATQHDIQCAIQQALAALVDVRISDISQYNPTTNEWRVTLSDGSIHVIDSTNLLAQLAALDKHVTAFQSYNTTTNIGELLLSDGTTVPVDFTSIINDTLQSISLATDTTAGIVQLNQGNNLPADITDCGAALTACGLSAILAQTGALNPIQQTIINTYNANSLTAAPQYPSVSDTTGATPAYVAAAIADSGNIFMTREDISAITLESVTYTNNTNKPLLIILTQSAGSLSPASYSILSLGDYFVNSTKGASVVPVALENIWLIVPPNRQWRAVASLVAAGSPFSSSIENYSVIKYS